MRIGGYTSCLDDRTLDEASALIADLGLRSAEVDVGGFLPSVHLPTGRRGRRIPGHRRPLGTGTRP